MTDQRRQAGLGEDRATHGTRLERQSVDAGDLEHTANVPNAVQTSSS